MSKILLIGELILDTTAPVCLPYQTRTVRRRIEPIAYQQLRSNTTELGGVFYIARFLSNFSDVIVLYPHPCEDNYDRETIKKLRKKLKFTDHPIPLDNTKIYEAKRFVELEDPENVKINSDWAKGHAFVRLDSGDTKPVASDKLNSVIKELGEILDSNRTDLKCIVLADYDLGLFSPEFIDKIGNIINEKARNKPIVIYSGRQWGRYSILWDSDKYSLKNCSIVTESLEAEDEIAGMDGYNKSDNRGFCTSKFIASRYPRIRNFVLVDGKRTRIASWKQDKETSPIEVHSASQSTDRTTPRTAVGHRALIAALLSLRLAENKEDAMSILPLVNEVTGCNGAVLLGESLPLNVDSIKKSLCANVMVEEDLQIVSPSEIFYQKMLKDNLILRISDAQTVIDGYITFDKDHKENIKILYDNLMQLRLEKCLYHNRAYQKALIWGESGCGKSALADLIKKKLGDNRKKLKFNAKKDVSEDPDKAKSDIENYIKDYNPKLDWNVYIWDEVGKLGKTGESIQNKIFDIIELFDNEEPKAKSIILVTNSFTKMSDFENPPPGNVKDFLDRLPNRLYVPPLAERVLDVPYIFAYRLSQKGVCEVSLKGLLAVTNKHFTSTRNLVHWTNEFIRANVKDGSKKVGDDAFSEICEELPFHVSDGRYVMIVQ